MSEEQVRTLKDYKSEVKPIWCPGCGDYAVLNAFYRAINELGLEPEKIAIASGIGCSGRFPAFCRTYGFHGVHGRALPLALGMKLANPELHVFAIAGDGDAFSIGAGHFPHMCRRNPNVTLIVMDNEIYGLTKGQPSPTSPLGMERKASPYGTHEWPLNPIAMAISYECSFVARCFSSKLKEMVETFEAAIQHDGFSFVQVMSPCVTFYDTYSLWKKITAPLPEDHDPADKYRAMAYALDEEKLFLGLFYRRPRPSYEGQMALVHEQAAKKGAFSLEKFASSYGC